MTQLALHGLVGYFTGKGRLRTFSSTSESRKFKQQKKRNRKRPCLVYYTILTIYNFFRLFLMMWVV